MTDRPYDLAQASILAAHGVEPDSPQWADAMQPSRIWSGPVAARHWPNVYLQLVDLSWLEVCRCGEIFVGDRDEVDRDAAAHMPLMVAWSRGEL